MSYNTATIRRLLLDAFSDEAFDILCQDYFPQVYNEISRGMSRSEKIRLLFDYCQQRNEFDQLLTRVEQQNPAQFARYADRLYSPIYTRDSTYLFIPQRRDFYRHISLPPNYVPRPDLLAEVREALLSQSGDVALTSAIKMNVLHGMGGIGKSVLARALCDDEAIQAAFPDGIMWITLGQTPELRSRLREVITALDGVIRETAPTEAMLKEQLGQLLHKRACLIILDDVWQRTIAETFRVDAPDSRLLLTTRDAEIAHQLSVRVQPVPVMALPEAVALLEQSAVGDLDETDAILKQSIVKRLGRLPLALKLAGSQLRRKDPTQWLERFNIAKLKSRRIETIHDSLVATFNLSLDELDDQARHLYTTLAIFKEDEATPLVAVEKLWSALASFNTEETEDLLDDLAARALLQLNPIFLKDDEAINNTHQPLAVTHRITLHDLLRNLIKAELGADGLFTAHQALLATYRQTQTDDGWHTANDDGYLYDHLAYHLDAVADHDPTVATELKQLFVNDAWLHVRVLQSNYEYDGYIADLMLVWSRVHNECRQQFEAGQSPTALVDCIRYALIRTSINSLAANYVPELVARAVEVGLWTPERAMSVAAKIPDVGKRAQVYTALLPTENLSQSQRESAQIFGLEAISEIVEDLGRERLLVKLIPLLDDFFLKPVLEIALEIKDKRSLVEVLTELVPRLQMEAKQEALEQAVSAAHEIEYVSTRAKLVPYLNEPIRSDILAKATEDVLASGGASSMVSALTNLIPHLNQETRKRLLSRALDELQNTDGEVLYYALADLAPHLHGQLLQQALELAYNSEFGDVRAWTLANLAQYATGDTKHKAIKSSLETALTLDSIEDQAWPLIILLPQLAEEDKHQVSEHAFELTLRSGNFRLLTHLAPHVNKERLSEVIDTLLERPGIFVKNIDIKGIASYLDQRHLIIVLASALSISDEPFQVDAIIEITNQLKTNAKKEILNSALEITRFMKRNTDKISKLKYLTLSCDEKLSVKLLEEALMLANENEVNSVLRYFSYELDQELSLRVLDLITAMKNDVYRANSLINFLRIANQNLKDKVTIMTHKAVLDVNDNIKQVKMFIALAPYLIEEVRIEVLTKCLSISLDISDVKSRAEVLTTLALKLEGKNKKVALSEAFDAALIIEDDFDYINALIDLVRPASGELKKEIFEHVWQAISSIYEGKKRALAIVSLLNQLDQETERKVFNILFPTLITSDDEDFKAMLLIFYVNLLDKELLTNAISIARTFTIDEHCARILTQLASRLEGRNKEQALIDGFEAALKVKKRETRRDLLVNLMPHLQGKDKEVALTEAFRASLPANDERSLSRGRIDDLLPYLQEFPLLSRQLGKYIVQHLMLIKDEKRSNVLSMLSVRGLFDLSVLDLPEDSWIKMAETIRGVCQKWQWL